MEATIEIGDLVRITSPKHIGIVVKIDRTVYDYKRRYWVRLVGRDITFPFMSKKVERIN